MGFRGYRRDRALLPAERADARAALALLFGTGMSLEEAARRVLHGRRALRRVKLADARNEFVRTRLALRARTVEWYENKLALPLAKFGEQLFDDVDRGEFCTWLSSLPVSAGTRAGIVRACRALWRWGMAQEPQLVARDITAGLAGTGPGNGGEAEFLLVDEVVEILKNAGPYRSALAMLFFSGVRPEELAGRDKPPLLWRHVRFDERLIRIPAEIAKTGKPRLIERMPDTLWAWLEPQKETMPISPGRTRQALERAQAALGIGMPGKRKRWPPDATRHTFATYAYALGRDAGQVASWLGHEGAPGTFHRHYRGLAARAEAERYFALRPEKLE